MSPVHLCQFLPACYCALCKSNGAPEAPTPPYAVGQHLDWALCFSFPVPVRRRAPGARHVKGFSCSRLGNDHGSCPTGRCCTPVPWTRVACRKENEWGVRRRTAEPLVPLLYCMHAQYSCADARRTASQGIQRAVSKIKKWERRQKTPRFRTPA